MSSNFCLLATAIRVAIVSAAVFGAPLAGHCAWAANPGIEALPPERFGDVVRLEGNELVSFHGTPSDRLALFACEASCAPIPWQLDERDAAGRLVLDQGPEPTADDPPGVLDANDVVLFMASDAGVRADRFSIGIPGATASVEIEVRDPRTARRRWVYLLRFERSAPRSSRSYVAYDPTADRITGARVALGFAHGTPRFLGLVGGQSSSSSSNNLLDRMKIRATARFLWGLISVTRTEDDVQTQPVAWRQGPIRVIRRQRLWIRLGWGLRTPIFGSDTYFYRDFAELPVALHLNFPPHLLFTDVTIRAALDFRNLNGWELQTAATPSRIRIDGRMTADKLTLAHQSGDWFALHGPDLTLVQVLALSPSLSTVRRQLFYRESRDLADPPEADLGEMPGIGYSLTQWDAVSSGDHWFASNSYALPRDLDVAALIGALQQPLQVTVRP